MIGDPPRLVVRRHFARPGPDELAPFEGRPTSFVADAASGRGVLDPAIKPLEARMRFLGPALTVDTGARDNLAALAALDFVQPGDVLVLKTGGHTAAACVGDILVKIAKKKGVVAIVTDGAVRDVDDILPLGLPVFCRAITPSSAFPSGPGAIGVAMAIGDVAIEPGDAVMGDRDGVVVVAGARLAEIRARLDEVVAREAELQAKVDAGEVRSLLPAAFADQITYLD